MSEVNMDMGTVIYNSICAVLDGMELTYEKLDDQLAVLFGFKGEDMNHSLAMVVNAEQEAIQLMEQLPFSINPEKMTDIAVATCYVNNRLLSGAFICDMEEHLSFELTQLYSGSLIGEETITRMIMSLIYAVETYDDKFLALNKGYITTDAFKEA